MASFALDAGDELLLVDPLLPDENPAPILDVLDGLADARAVHCLITIGYHVRSAEALAVRWSGRIWGPPRSATRLRDKSLLEVLEPGVTGPGGAVAHAIGKPVRGERPLWLPSHRAIAFGDAVVTTPEGDLRVWAHEPLDDRRLRFYRDKFAPTLEPLLALPADHVLVTHGSPVVGDGAAALRRAVETEPWFHRG